MEKTDRPQVKICDFGYAKIIGDGSYRKSIVGTAAYSRNIKISFLSLISLTKLKTFFSFAYHI